MTITGRLTLSSTVSRRPVSRARGQSGVKFARSAGRAAAVIELSSVQRKPTNDCVTRKEKEKKRVITNNEISAYVIKIAPRGPRGF